LFNETFDGNYFGNVSGSGSLQIHGGNTLTLYCDNSYSGNTTLFRGTLRLGNHSRFSDASSVVINTGTFDLNGFSEAIGSLAGGGSVSLGSGTLFVGANGLATDYFGGISGSGSIVKTGGGDFYLSGANSHSGGTVMDGGRLFIKTGAIGNGPLTFNAGTICLGVTSAEGNPFFSDRPVTLGAGAGTLYTFGNAATLSGNISGSGGLNKSGFGKLTLTGTNSYLGNTVVTQHEIRGTTNSIKNNLLISASAAIEFDQGFDGTFSGSIDGAGSLSKFGTGTVSLTGSVSNTVVTWINNG